jgi:hypothetical protein
VGSLGAAPVEEIFFGQSGGVLLSPQDYGDPTCGGYTVAGTANPLATSIQAIDMNGDGLPDLVIGTNFGGFGLSINSADLTGLQSCGLQVDLHSLWWDEATWGAPLRSRLSYQVRSLAVAARYEAGIRVPKRVLLSGAAILTVEYVFQCGRRHVRGSVGRPWRAGIAGVATPEPRAENQLGCRADPVGRDQGPLRSTSGKALSQHGEEVTLSAGSRSSR